MLPHRPPPGLALPSWQGSPSKVKRDISRAVAHRIHQRWLAQRAPDTEMPCSDDQLVSDTYMSTRNASPSGGRSETLHGLHRPEVFIAGSSSTPSLVAPVGPCSVPATGGSNVEPLVDINSIMCAKGADERSDKQDYSKPSCSYLCLLQDFAMKHGSSVAKAFRLEASAAPMGRTRGIFPLPRITCQRMGLHPIFALWRIFALQV